MFSKILVEKYPQATGVVSIESNRKVNSGNENGIRKSDKKGHMDNHDHKTSKKEKRKRS